MNKLLQPDQILEFTRILKITPFICRALSLLSAHNATRSLLWHLIINLCLINKNVQTSLLKEILLFEKKKMLCSLFANPYLHSIILASMRLLI